MIISPCKSKADDYSYDKVSSRVSVFYILVVFHYGKYIPTHNTKRENHECIDQSYWSVGISPRHQYQYQAKDTQSYSKNRRNQKKPPTMIQNPQLYEEKQNRLTEIQSILSYRPRWYGRQDQLSVRFFIISKKQMVAILIIVLVSIIIVWYKVYNTTQEYDFFEEYKKCVVKEYQVPPCQPIRQLDWWEEYNRIMDDNHK